MKASQELPRGNVTVNARAHTHTRRHTQTLSLMQNLSDLLRNH